jgi:hypothetical protein
MFFRVFYLGMAPLARGDEVDGLCECGFRGRQMMKQLRLSSAKHCNGQNILCFSKSETIEKPRWVVVCVWVKI